jgi:hypothetical protein
MHDTRHDAASAVAANARARDALADAGQSSRACGRSCRSSRRAHGIAGSSMPRQRTCAHATSKAPDFTLDGLDAPRVDPRPAGRRVATFVRPRRFAARASQILQPPPRPQLERRVRQTAHPHPLARLMRTLA